jgi:hypothetical protein
VGFELTNKGFADLTILAASILVLNCANRFSQVWSGGRFSADRRRSRISGPLIGRLPFSGGSCAAR